MILRINSIELSESCTIVKSEWVFDEGEQDVVITFDDMKTELLDSVDCYDKVYLAVGYDAEGNKYTASAVYSCDELIELEDIEVSEYAFEKSFKSEYEAKKAAGDFDPENIGLTPDERYLKDFNAKRELSGLKQFDF